VCVCVVVLSAAAVTTLAGNITAGFFDALGSNANFNNPTDVAVDASGNVFVADFQNHRIRKVTPGGGTRVGPVMLHACCAVIHGGALVIVARLSSSLSFFVPA
jgi:hypothetical protein